MDEGLLKPGEVLNNTYRIEELVGEGGTGEVYRAINTAAHRTVAIKILKAQFSQDPKFINLMRRELLHNVSDSAVVRYYDLLRTAEDHGGLYFLVMDFIDGPSMADLMQKGPVPVETLMILADRVAHGLAACHENSIFHRDISPDNIILRGNNPDEATLIDFGIAKDVRPDAKTVVGGGFAGKYEYAAPEQLDGLADARSDIYSFGMTLLAAARGESPKLGTSFLEIVKAKHTPVDTTGIGEPLRGLIDAMVRPAPEDRPQSAAELLKLTRSGATGGQPPIESLMEPDPDDPPARRTTDSRSKPTPPEKKKGKGGLIAAVLGLALVGGGALVALKPGLIPGFGDSLPVAIPYSFTTNLQNGKATATGNVTSADAATDLAAALKKQLPISDDELKLTPASGAPNTAWRSTVTAMAAEVSKLDRGELKFRDDQVTLSGMAPSEAVKSDVEKTARTIAKNGEYRLALSLSVARDEAAEKARIAREQAEKERLAKLEEEKLAREKAEADRLAKIEADKRERERAEAERLQIEQARLEQERREKEEFERALAARQLSEAEKREEQRKERERVERLRAEREKAEQERIARELAEKKERDRLAAEQAEKDRIAAELAEKKRLAAEQAEKDRIARELAAKEERERIAAEEDRKARELAEKEERERIAAEQAEKERAEEEKRREDERLAALAAEDAQRLKIEEVEGILDPYVKCGPLKFKPASEKGYGPTETIRITGFVASERVLADVRKALGKYSGARTVDTSGVEVVNDSVCIVIDVMPDEESGPAEFLFYSAKSGELVDVDALKPDDQAVVYVSTPKDLEGYLYVFVSDNEYGTYHLRPAPLNEEHQLSKIGKVEGNERRIQLTWPLAQGSRKRPALAFTKPYGKSRLFMLILRDNSLFKHLRANEDTRELVPVLRKGVIESILRRKILSHKQRFVLVDED